jgi:hypothetical protein
MNLFIHIDLAQYPSRVRWLMAMAWILILAKCILIWWAVEHWQVPVHAFWVIGPTLVFAGLASLLWLTHARE